MKVIEAPEASPELLEGQSALFLAGGITACPDWQTTMIKLLVETGIDYIYNPRRKSFPIDDPSQMEVQVRWEHEHLRKATAIAFWFPDSSVQPIALFEFGRWLGPWKAVPKLGSRKSICIELVKKQLFVGVHPSYHRKADVYLQTQLESPFQQIVSSLPDLVTKVKEWGGGIPTSAVEEPKPKKKKKKKKKNK